MRRETERKAKRGFVKEREGVGERERGRDIESQRER